MRIVNKTKTSIESVVETDASKYYVTFTDMGSYIGYRSRPWYAKAPQAWKTTKFNCVDNKTSKVLSSQEFLYDEQGNVMRIIATDSFDSKRIRHYYHDEEYVTSVEEMERLHGKGFSREEKKMDKQDQNDWFLGGNGYWVQDIVYSNGVQYFYDSKTGKFIDEKNNILISKDSKVDLANIEYMKNINSIAEGLQSQLAETKAFEV